MATENEKLMAIEEKIDAQIEALKKLQEELEEIDGETNCPDIPEQYIMDIDSAIMALEERGSIL